MPSLTTIVMAGGLGTRMRSERPKVLFELCGRPMLAWVVEAARDGGADEVVCVVSPGVADAVRELLPGVVVAVQEPAHGTGHAVETGLAALDHTPDEVLVLSGDTPAIPTESIRRVVEARRAAGAAGALATMRVPPPSPYGRVLRDAAGDVTGIVEARDADAEQQRIDEVNVALYCFDGAALADALGRLVPENAQGERYLTDAVGLIATAGGRVVAVPEDDPSAGHGINTMVELAALEAVLNRRLLERAMLDGARIVDPGSTFVDVGVELAPGCRIEPFTVLRGRTSVGPGAVVGPHVVATDASIGPDCLVGPFACLRPGTVLDERARLGRFVEAKNAHLAAGAKAMHLTYLGDVEIGEEANIGAGNVTANYDGQRKHRTVIGTRVKTGANAVFVAPVAVGDDAVVGAVSAITDDVPPGALGVARPRQTTIEGYAERVARRRGTT